jgi:hypothetical protein
MTDPVADRRAASLLQDGQQRRREAGHRSAILRRHRTSTWPLDSRTLEPAEHIDPGDVRMPMAPPAPPLEGLQGEGRAHQHVRRARTTRR